MNKGLSLKDYKRSKKGRGLQTALSLELAIDFTQIIEVGKSLLGVATRGTRKSSKGLDRTASMKDSMLRTTRFDVR